MIRINLKDENFPHQEYSSPFCQRPSFEWDRTCSQPGPVVYTDMYLNDDLIGVGGEKIAWLVEPASIYPYVYYWLVQNYTLFTEVWTHDEEVMSLVPNARFVPTGGCWIEPASIRIAGKSRLCSFIASSKDWTEGHRLRQQIRAMLPAHIPQFGKGFREIALKSAALNDYAYSIAVENINRDAYFSEKIMDCFLTGTVPVYWGSQKVAEYFDPDGIIFFQTLEELQHILERISMDEYAGRMAAITSNFETAKNFMLPEEWGVKHLLAAGHKL
ncbi:glycosyltransferase family 10 domain-containing protein [Chitinophaga japonensis]|uniref:Glycosyl transferase family 10 (Putative fucosyltransferase) n=1 Tax=Chitinophaga japonensis TaxID=104662 RepID=A0A562STJ3_CHIJA|nr:glycosyltransferase family 10 [Chitinophaga japonensis]TWI84561.1 glycosyl transferase family 10 (putative fucosyltransferase) [Chitinophaga japonensis]